MLYIITCFTLPTLCEASHKTGKTITVTQSASSASSDASLSSLSVNQGALTPSFSPGVTNYNVSVPNTVSSVTITASLNDAGANVAGTGIKDLSIGANIFVITVTASDNITTSNYTVTVTCEQEVDPSTPTSIAFDQSPYSAMISEGGNTTVAVSAKVKDQYGNVMNGCSSTYSLVGSYAAGISINKNTGVVTVQSAFAAGTVNIKATYGSLSGTVALILTRPAGTYTLHFMDRYSSTYEVSGYVVDLAIDTSIQIEVCAKDSQGTIVTAPELVSMVFTTEYGRSNTTGIFQVWEFGFSDEGEFTYVTVTATFSNGAVAQKSAWLESCIIGPLPTSAEPGAIPDRGDFEQEINIIDDSQDLEPDVDISDDQQDLEQNAESTNQQNSGRQVDAFADIQDLEQAPDIFQD